MQRLLVVDHTPESWRVIHVHQCSPGLDLGFAYLFCYDCSERYVRLRHYDDSQRHGQSFEHIQRLIFIQMSSPLETLRLSALLARSIELRPIATILDFRQISISSCILASFFTPSSDRCIATREKEKQKDYSTTKYREIGRKDERNKSYVGNIWSREKVIF